MVCVCLDQPLLDAPPLISPAPTQHPHQDAMKFPFIGSAVLVSLFAAFRFLPKHWVNAALTLYFVVLGTAALAATVLPFVEAAFTDAARRHKYVLARGVKVPYLMKVSERVGVGRKG